MLRAITELSLASASFFQPTPATPAKTLRFWLMDQRALMRLSLCQVVAPALSRLAVSPGPAAGLEADCALAPSRGRGRAGLLAPPPAVSVPDDDETSGG